MDSQIGLLLATMKKPTQTLLTPDHPAWGTFLDALEGPSGCNFRRQDDGNMIWTCQGSLDRARTLLSQMAEIDADATLRFYEALGGTCDCGILFYVER